MGNTFVAFIRTDDFASIEQDPEGFVEWLRENLSGQGSHGRERYGTEVMPVAHSTAFRLYALEGNTIVDLSRFSTETKRRASTETGRRWLVDVTEQAIRQARDLLAALKAGDGS